MAHGIGSCLCDTVVFQSSTSLLSSSYILVAYISLLQSPQINISANTLSRLTKFSPPLIRPNLGLSKVAMHPPYLLLIAFRTFMVFSPSLIRALTLP
ncbi:hypothetical protein GGR58DRAFT_475226 [Xylaria digitata]|nr:hypothetical protein GGR58DRAFT_475226 [Xylaria digitata]